MSEQSDTTRGAITPLRAAVANLCQNCGRGRLSDGFLRVVDRCEVCGADYRRHAAGDGAIYIVLTLLCVLAMAVLVSVEFAYRPPVWVHLLIGVGVIFGLALALLPPAKRFMVAQSFAMDARGDGEMGGGIDGEGSA